MDVRSTALERWGILFSGPLLFLATEAAATLLAPWSCARGSTLALHATHAAGLLLALAVVLAARRSWREAGAAPRAAGGGAGEDRRFLATLGLLSAATFALLTLALWLPSLALDPCGWL